MIGAGHAGLAVSNLLGQAGRDHVVVDRGRVAEAWRSERWDSLHLLSPRWMTRLPGWRYTGPDQEGFMPGAELVHHLEQYAAASGSPLELGQEVYEVAAAGDGYRVVTDSVTWQARHVVVATGPTGRPRVPATAHELDPDVDLVPALRYRNPDALRPGGVLVVGASASGLQIADDLARAGRHVVLSVGSHTRMPRRYRGMDAHWWLELTGRLAATIDTVADPVRARREPSLQLAGRAPDDPRGDSVDLATVQALDVELVGRLGSFTGRVATFATDLATNVGESERRQSRFLDLVDAHVETSHLASEVGPADRPRPVPVPVTRERIDLRAEGISTVVIATGYVPHHPWLKVPVTDRHGAIQQRRGATAAPGLYVVGQRFQHRRDSGTLDGARHDARDVVAAICADDCAALRELELR